MYIDVKKEDNIGFVLLKNPPANSLSQAMIQEIDDAMEELHMADDVKVVILHGEGRMFSGGADIKEFTQVSAADSFHNMSRKGQQTFKKN